MSQEPHLIEADIAIVGAGPAGTAAAVHLGQLGVKNVVLLDRLDFPRDKTCGSGLSAKGIKTLKALGVWHEVEPEAYWIKGLRLVTPGDQEMYVSGGDAAAAVICNRRVLDHILVKRAIALGVRFVPHFYARELHEESGRVTGVSAVDGRRVQAKYVIVADGAHSKFTVTKKPKKLLQAIMGWWDDVPYRAHHVEMVLDKMVMPYYGWLFPESERRVNIGICYEDDAHQKNARQLFKAFLAKHYADRLRGATQVGDFKGHPISYSYEIEQLYAPGRIIVGEAGRMTHPATAEGIYQGMRTGMYAAEALAEVLAHKKSEAEAFAAYEMRCKKTFLLSFFGAKIWLRIIQSPTLDWVARTGKRPMVKAVASRLMAQA